MGRFNPPHPGLLLDAYLGEASIAVAVLRHGMTCAKLLRIRNLHSPFYLEKWVRLGILFGMRLKLWLGKQSIYELWVEHQKP